MRKGMASHILGIVLIIAVFSFFLVLIVYDWLNTQGLEANQFTCSSKLLNYCADWAGNGFNQKPWDWSQKDPKNCDIPSIKISEPLSPADCKALLGTR
jgi:hypothetical protein